MKNEPEKRVLLFGANSDVARFLVKSLLEKNFIVDQVTRNNRLETCYSETRSSLRENLRTIDAGLSYSTFQYTNENYRYIFFLQGIFNQKILMEYNFQEYKNDFVESVLTPMELCRNIISSKPSSNANKRDFVFFGSTLSYKAAPSSVIYTVQKHSLLGFVRSMNIDLASTGDRFVLVSMGPVDTKMIKKRNQMVDDKILIDPEELAKFVTKILVDENDFYQEEIIIKKRYIA